jgi:hypothetical protein
MNAKNTGFLGVFRRNKIKHIQKKKEYKNNNERHNFDRKNKR